MDQVLNIAATVQNTKVCLKTEAGSGKGLKLYLTELSTQDNLQEIKDMAMGIKYYAMGNNTKEIGCKAKKQEIVDFTDIRMARYTKDK